MVRIMSTFLLTLLGLTAGSTYPCAVRREIAPCTCRLQEPKLTTIVVACEQMPSFANLVEVLHNRFPPEQDISLKVSFSQLHDLEEQSFKDLGMSVSNLNLNFDGLSYLHEPSFTGLEGVEYLSLADNKMSEVPRKALRRMPKLKTLDLGRSRISALMNEDFEGLPTLQHLLLPSNNLLKIESQSLPLTMRRIHLGRNNLRDLNSSLRMLTDLEWLFINGNQLTTLYDQLPPDAPKLILIHAANNLLQSLPPELRNYQAMDSAFFSSNNIESLDGVLQKARRLKRLHLTHNRIHTLADDDFAESELMDDLQMGHNHLQAINGAFRPMKKLRTLNLTNNHLEEFSLQEIRGLHNLKVVDLSHNRIQRLTGRMENLVELETRIEELHLEYNELEALEGALFGIHGLQRLSLKNNKLRNIAPDDLIGLDDLRLLDISFNHLKTLEETSKTFLPRLQELVATNNLLTSLDKDFHGLPVLCRADLSHNRIRTIGHELASKTHCGSIGGMLMVALYDNPVICNSEFNDTSAYMLANMTLLQGDYSICPEVIITTPAPPSTTTTTTPTPPTTDSTILDTTVAILPPIDLATLIWSPPPEPAPQVIPLVYSVELLSPMNNRRENLVDPLMLKANITETSESENNTQQPTLPPITKEVVLQPAEELTVTEASEDLPPPIVVLKDEGQNLTLVIPMKNGVIKSDSGAEQYTQKEDSRDHVALKRPSAITNIEIVDINPLPEEAPSLTILGRDERKSTSP